MIRIDQIVDFFQKNGYPFTSVKMDSIKLENKKLSGFQLRRFDYNINCKKYLEFVLNNF